MSSIDQSGNGNINLVCTVESYSYNKRTCEKWYTGLFETNIIGRIDPLTNRLLPNDKHKYEIKFIYENNKIADCIAKEILDIITKENNSENIICHFQIIDVIIANNMVSVEFNKQISGTYQVDYQIYESFNDLRKIMLNKINKLMVFA